MPANEIQYGALVQESWRLWTPNWWRLSLLNLLTFVLGLVAGLLMLGFMVLFLEVLGIHIFDVRTFLASATLGEYMIVGVFAIVLVLVGVVVGAYLEGLRVGAYYDAAVGKRVVLRGVVKYAGRFFPMLVKIGVVRAALTIIPLLAVGAVGFLLYLQKFSFSVMLSLMMVGGLVTVAAAVFFWFALFFLYPLLAAERGEKSAWKMVKKSLAFSRMHLSRVMLTALIRFGFWLALSIVMGMLGLLVKAPFVFLGMQTAILVAGRAWSVAGFLADEVLASYNLILTYKVAYVKD